MTKENKIDDETAIIFNLFLFTSGLFFFRCETVDYSCHININFN